MPQSIDDKLANVQTKRGTTLTVHDLIRHVIPLGVSVNELISSDDQPSR